MDINKMTQAELNRLFDSRLSALEKDCTSKDEPKPKAVKEKVEK